MLDFYVWIAAILLLFVILVYGFILVRRMSQPTPIEQVMMFVTELGKNPMFRPLFDKLFTLLLSKFGQTVETQKSISNLKNQEYDYGEDDYK